MGQNRYFPRRFHHCQRGFTLLELLVMLAILGILAGVIIPNVSGFLKSGELAAANTEVQNMETASLAYHAKTEGWPATSNNLTGEFLAGTPKAVYTFDTAYGWVLTAGPNGTLSWTGLTFSSGVPGLPGRHGKWVK